MFSNRLRTRSERRKEYHDSGTNLTEYTCDNNGISRIEPLKDFLTRCVKKGLIRRGNDVIRLLEKEGMVYFNVVGKLHARDDVRKYLYNDFKTGVLMVTPEGKNQILKMIGVC